MEDFASAMSLHDVCHSIDSPDIGFILEIVKFPNSDRAETRHECLLNYFPDRSAGAPGRRRGAAARADRRGAASARCKKAQSAHAVADRSVDRRAGSRG